MTYRGMMLLLYLGAMIWAIVESKKKWKTAGVMFSAWAGALVLIIAFACFIQDGARAERMWGIPSFAIPAIAGVMHARKHRYDLTE